MADGHAVHDPDRLPWLADTRRRRRSSDSNLLLAWAVVATLLVAGVSYWLGMTSVTGPEAFDSGSGSRPAATVRLPEPVLVPPRVEEVLPAAPPEAQPVAEPAAIAKPEPVRESRARAERPKPAGAKAATAARKARSRAAPVKKKARGSTQLQAWPAERSAGAHGRVVRVGTFYSRSQAKRGWSRIVRVYPGMGRLRAVVVANQSHRTGQTFYRLQFGTTSQAHSAVLCQRMRIIGQSCVVVGLPGRQGGVR